MNEVTCNIEVFSTSLEAGISLIVIVNIQHHLSLYEYFYLIKDDYMEYITTRCMIYILTNGFYDKKVASLLVSFFFQKAFYDDIT